jgi:hypothetical protein
VSLVLIGFLVLKISIAEQLRICNQNVAFRFLNSGVTMCIFNIEEMYMNKQLLTYGFIAALAVASVGMAAEPYTIRSSDDPVDVPNAVPIAVVATSPFDDDSGILSDGLDHYYLVTDAAGQPVLIAVEKNPVLDTLRISFDDANPYSAPVDPGLSTVTVVPSTIDADGVSQAVVTIIPRDSQGVALGTGLAIEIDTASLWPGWVAGTVEDLGNGVYVVRVVSVFTGSGSVQIAVEGIAITATPAVYYEEALGSGTLLEQAIRLFEDVTDNGGDFDQLLALVSGDAADIVDEALNHTLDALTLLLYPDSGGHGEAVGRHMKRAIEDLIVLTGMVDAETAGEVINLIHSLLEAGRKVAMYYILETSAECGTCSETGEKNLCKAEASLALGDSAWQATPPDYMTAITKYGIAVEQALKGADVCY